MANLRYCFFAAFAISFYNTVLASSDPDLWPYFKNSEDTTVNKTKLFLLALQFYVTPPICSNTSIQNLETSIQIGNDLPCSCRKTCFARDMCCLDHPYKAVIYSCLDVVLYPHNARLKLVYSIVTTCELHGLIYVELCNMNTDNILTTDDPIVTSVKSGLSYKNKYCALCYLEQEEDLSSWELHLYCREDLTKMAMTSLDIMSLLKSNIRNEICVIAYYPESLDHIVEKCLVNEILSSVQRIQTCNVSGLWVSYDADLEWACKHFDLPYRGFKNVFCYICNPSIVSKRYSYGIDQCNKTGLWRNFDSDIFKHCQSFSIEPRWWPFKNVFCCLCNSFDGNIHSSMYHVMPLSLNTEGRVSESYDNDKKQFTTVIEFVDKSIDQDSLIKTVQSRFVDTFLNRSICAVENQDANQNADECISFSCSSACPVKISCCRRYVTQEEHFMCIHDELQFGSKQNSEKAYLAIGSCPEQTDGNLLQKCTNVDTKDILQVLPVTFFDKIIFRNVYCGQCNSIFHSRPLDLIVRCNVYIDAALLTALQGFIEIALEENCSLKYLSRDNCDEKQNYITKCNTTGLWQGGSKTIQTACESNAEIRMSSLGISVLSLTERYFEGYMNVYCYVCNPKENMPRYYKCNVTGRWTMYNSSVEKLCLTVDRDLVWGPFKNIYCLMCNTPVQLAAELFRLDDTLDFIFQASYRTIFRISPNFFETYNQEESTTQCPGGETPCEKIRCAEGKVVYNNSCDYPIEALYNKMEYGMYFRTEFSGHTSNESFHISIKTEEIIDTLRQVISLELGKFDSFLITWKFHVWTSFPCNSLLLTEDTVLYAFVSMQILKDSGSFKLLEEHFIKEIGQTIILKDTELAVKLVPDYNFLYLFQNSANMSETVCYLQSESFEENGKHLKVFSDMLICSQRELNYGFVLDDFKNVYIPTINVTLNKFQFQFISETIIKICSHIFDEIQNITKSQSESRLDSLSIVQRPYIIFSFLCTCLSIFCLLLTLLIYLIHSELRTRPGKLNISLAVSLLLAQSSLQFGLKQTVHKYICIFMGICIHFSWLTTFFCFNICTWNIYITFTSSLATMNQLSMNRSVPIYYILYMICVPFAIVVGTLVFHLVKTNLEFCGYGGRICFISDDLTSVVAFIFPAVLICLANAVLYALTFHSLRKSPTLRTNQDKRREFFIFLRLFFITGISWISQIVDAIYVITPLSYIATFINALQGVFIFMAFVCNKRVLQLFKTRFQKPVG